MACYGLYKDRYIIQTRVLPPNPWESLSEFCQDVFEASFITSNKRLVVCVNCTGQTYKLDLSTAKSATFICAVGISFGLGGFILYKLYCRFIQPLFKKPPKKKKSHNQRNDTGTSKTINGIEEETDMGNSHSNKPETSAYFSPTTGVALHVGRKSHNREHLKTQTESRVRLKKKVKRRKPSSDSALSKSAPIKVPSSQSDASINHLLYSTSEVSNDLEGSLKANLSLQSLTDRNLKEIDNFRHSVQESHFPSRASQSDIEVLRGNAHNLDSDVSVRIDDFSNKENFDTLAARNSKLHIELSDDLLTVSSVLLTPPSEDDSHLNSKRSEESHSKSENLLVLQNNNYLSQQPLSSYSSDYNTDSKKSCPVSVADDSCSCDEKDSVSSLPKLRSPDRFFRENLLHRLNDCHNGAGSSNSSSLDSSPEFSPYTWNRKYSIDTDNLSGLATPDSEIFNSYCEVGRFTEDQFEHLEEEVLDIEDEFNSLTNKLNQLKNLALNSEGSSVEYSPSHPLAKKAVEIVDRTRNRLSRSRSLSVSSTDSSPACSFDMPDFSWDSEGLHADHSNKSTPSNRRGSEPVNSLRNKLHSKLINKNASGHNGMSFESPLETDYEIDGTLDSLSTDECFGTSSQSDWVRDSSGEGHSKTDLSLSQKHTSLTASKSNSIKMSSDDCSSSVYESARDSSNGAIGNGEMEKIDGCKQSGDNVSKNVIPSQKQENNGTEQVSDKKDITEYVESEWKGQTDKAKTIRQAYKEIPKITGCHNLCRVRGDNYCGLRGTLFQCLSLGIDITKRWTSFNDMTNKLTQRYNETSSGLQLWTFAGRLSCNNEQKLSVMSQCLSLLFSKFEEAKALESYCDRENWTINLLNSDPTCDLYLMEGLKLLMLLNVLDLNEKRELGDDIPIFVWLLFARDTSETPLAFVKNHLNMLGDSGGIEQIEMFLLGHTLGVRIQVLRLSQYGQEDFIAYYPDDADNNWSQISLIAEDDRHYNVPVP